ncbi:class I SAM-dependent methyltransferase [Paucibacter sp. KBW04]|uniref:class I SAM-dependent methyltransferase n=1 Tax=Paucibacter sp. KBW04 TaxID=2153361 RepID=UPI000F55FC62|nr:class I SAM-dependent methyltransferase [Paucibacter sp. KBW04]RQO54367.1 class I SAM-dependent methyltransferase [Paucibacter sp. KBW04]
MLSDVPSPIDLRLMRDAREWEKTAMSKRPWRTEFFEAFASEILSSGIRVRRILELGSGPGFLAEHLLGALPEVEYVALDFSLAMHELAAKRLGLLGSSVQFVERSFREPAWSNGLGQFGCIVTNQAVHELRHKRYAAELHQQVRSLLLPGGAYLVCDHFAGEGGMSNDQLYMTVAEQAAAFASAGFAKVDQVLLKGGLVLHRAC